MKRALVLVEGPTEETFVKEVLQAHFRPLQMHIEPKIVVTKRILSGGQFKGGIGSYGQVSNDLRRLFNDTNAAVITTMIDYYGLPDDFPGMASRPTRTFRERVAHVELEWAKHVNERRFLPHLVLHEFETFLFTDPPRLNYFPDDARARMGQVLAEFQDPEAINDSRATSPSHRILKLLPNYQKPLMGNIGVLDLGLETIRRNCTHFRSWLEALEQIATAPP